ncbi:MAG: magnesium transporter [Patescibacteria group bacterium]
MNHEKPIVYADDDTESVSMLLRLRVPVLLVGLCLGVLISLLTSRFEEVLKYDVRVAFFLPFIVYMAAALGSQTEAIYAGDLKNGKAKFHAYLVKESFIGFFVGAGFGLVSGIVAWWWMESTALGFSVGLSMFAALLVAPLVALITTQASQYLREDPAVESGPVATVIQDMVSVVIYGTVSSFVIL